MTDGDVPADLVAALDPYDRTELAAGAGALQVMPENANRLLRLTRLAAAVMSLPPADNRHSISVGRWRQLTNQPPLAASYAVRNEDPFNDIFVEELTLPIGSFRVSSGLLECAVFQLKQLLIGLARSGHDIDQKSRSQALRIGIATCALSDMLWTRVGLRRGTKPEPATGTLVTVPDLRGLSRLMEAVTLPVDDLAAVLDGLAVSADDLRPLVTRLGTENSLDYDGTILLRPLLADDDQIIVASPASLIPSAMEAIVRSLIASGHQRTLAKLYLDEGVRSVKHSLWMLRWTEMAAPPIPLALPTAEDGIFRFDTDKLAYVIVISEDFEGYEGGETRVLDEMGQAVVARIVEVQDAILTRSQLCNEVFHLVVMNMGARGSLLPLPDGEFDNTVLLMTTHDLEVMARLESGQPLRLWRWAQARSRLIDSGVRMFAWNPLDDFAVYRGHGYGYYLSDDGRPTAINTALDGVGVLRAELADKFDPHGARLPVEDEWRDVVRLSSYSKLPVYITTEVGGIAELVVELDAAVWVSVAPATESELAEYAFHFAQVVAFWLARMGEDLKGALSAVSRQPIRIQLTMLPSRGWSDPSAVAGVGDTPCHVVVTEDAIDIRIEDGAWMMISDANAAERALMHAALSGLSEFVSRQSARS
jgi:hypothetical protein